MRIYAKVFLAILLLPCMAAQRGIFFSQNIPAGVSGCATPYSDSFSGSGALGTPHWKQYAGPTIGGPTMVNLIQSSGEAIPVTAGMQAMAAINCSTYASNQSAQFNVGIFFPPSQGGQTGPLIHADMVHGNFYEWVLKENTVILVTAGAFVSTVINTCPAETVSDVVKLSNVGSTITCTNVTAGTSASGTDPTYTGNSNPPGLWIDQSLDSVHPEATLWANQ